MNWRCKHALRVNYVGQSMFQFHGWLGICTNFTSTEHWEALVWRLNPNRSLVARLGDLFGGFRVGEKNTWP